MSAWRCIPTIRLRRSAPATSRSCPRWRAGRRWWGWSIHRPTASSSIAASPASWAKTRWKWRTGSGRNRIGHVHWRNVHPAQAARGLHRSLSRQWRQQHAGGDEGAGGGEIPLHDLPRHAARAGCRPRLKTAATMPPGPFMSAIAAMLQTR